MSLDSYLPDYFLREIGYLAVRTSPAETFRTICDFEMSKISWIDALFRLRTLADRPKALSSRLTLRDAYLQGGFVHLEEKHDEELVVGAIGKIWRPSISFTKVDSNDYGNFHKPGFGKVAWSLRCQPRISVGTLVSLEVRVGATDSVSAAKMRSYYSVIGPFSRAIRRSVFHHHARELGDLFKDELSYTMPGDSLIEKPAGSFTHGITIEAPAAAIWPWLVQMGCLRGGWYSHDWLDNAGVPSATNIVPTWQDIREGDVLNATPQGEGAFLLYLWIVCIHWFSAVVMITIQVK
jgi:hypothetical protein